MGIVTTVIIISAAVHLLHNDQQANVELYVARKVCYGLFHIQTCVAPLPPQSNYCLFSTSISIRCLKCLNVDVVCHNVASDVRGSSAGNGPYLRVVHFMPL